MYQQQLQPQQQPYLQAVPTIQPVMVPQAPQQDSVDQISRVIDLIDKVRQRQPGRGIEPGTSGYGQFNAGMFQNMPDGQLDRQEMLLRNPQLLQQNSQQQSQAQVQPGLDQQKTELLKQHIDQLFAATQQVINQRDAAVTISNAAMQAFNAASTQSIMLADYAAAGELYYGLANTYLQEVIAAEQMIAVQNEMLSNPVYLLGHAFTLWANSINANDGDFVELLSSLYMQLVGVFEQKHANASGQYTENYNRYLQSQVQQQQPQPGFMPTNSSINQQQQVSGIKEFAQALSQPGYGKQLQRAHSQIRQANAHR